MPDRFQLWTKHSVCSVFISCIIVHVDQTKCSSTIGNYDSSVEQCGPSFKLNQKTTVKKNYAQLFSIDCVIPQVGKIILNMYWGKGTDMDKLSTKKRL